MAVLLMSSLEIANMKNLDGMNFHRRRSIDERKKDPPIKGKPWIFALEE
jgi:hypothetical protein